MDIHFTRHSGINTIVIVIVIVIPSATHRHNIGRRHTRIIQIALR